MFSAEVRTNKGTCILQAPSVEAMYALIFRLNEDVFVGDVQVKAKDGKKDGVSGYWAGYVLSGLEKVYEERA